MVYTIAKINGLIVPGLLCCLYHLIIVMDNISIIIIINITHFIIDFTILFMISNNPWLSSLNPRIIKSIYHHQICLNNPMFSNNPYITIYQILFQIAPSKNPYTLL